MIITQYTLHITILTTGPRAPAAACRCGASSGSAVCTVARGYLRRPELTSERFVFIVAPVGAVGVFFNGLIAHV